MINKPRFLSCEIKEQSNNLVNELKEIEQRINDKFNKLLKYLTLMKWMMVLSIAEITCLVLKAFLP